MLASHTTPLDNEEITAIQYLLECGQATRADFEGYLGGAGVSDVDSLIEHLELKKYVKVIGNDKGMFLLTPVGKSAYDYIYSE